MQTFLRVLVLSAFAAAGVGLAVSVAMHADFLKIGGDDAMASTESHVGPLADAGPVIDEGGPTGIPQSPAVKAEWNPAVAGPGLDQVYELLKKMGDGTEALNAARKALTGQSHQDVNSPDSPAPPSPSPDDTDPIRREDSDSTEAQANNALPPPSSESPARRVPPESSITAGPGDRFSINIRQAEISEVLEMIGRQSGLSIIASPTTAGAVSATLNDVDALTALDIVARNAGFVLRRDGNVIYVGTPQELQNASLSRQSLSTRVYRPNYVTAVELQKLITPLLTQGVGQATISATGVAISTAAKQGIAASASEAGGNDFAGDEVVLIRDYESVLSYVDQVVHEVDQKPRQVSLEAMILSVRLNDENARGVNLELLRNQDNARLVSGIPLNDLAALSMTDGGLKFAFLDSSVTSLLTALETIGDTNVIASPRLMCLNKQRAEILIGSQLGYVSTTVTETSATQSVSFLEVGTQLRFRPFISSDGVIRLEVHPELSTGSVRIEQGFTLPDKEVTQVTTNIMCRDGRTIIIGGLMREDLTSTVSQIPLLGNLPYVGGLFRQTKETTGRREIIVLITPRVVHDEVESWEGEKTKFDYLERQENYADKMSVIGKRHYGLRYLRLARAAWNSGDLSAALRYVNLSLHFDPQNLEATTLHRAVVQSLPPEADNIQNHLQQGLTPFTSPVRDYSRQGIDWRGTPPPDAPPLDAIEYWEPGARRELIPYEGP